MHTDPLDPLWQDVAFASQALESNDTPYNRRTFIRTSIAAVEGLIAFLRMHAIADVEHGALRVSIGEMAILREEAYSVSDSGAVTVRHKFVPLDSSIRFLFSTYFDRRREGVTIDFSDARWAAFKRSLKVRHRITHPRRAVDLEVSDSELQDVRLGYAWVHATVFRTYADLLRRLPDRQ